MLLKLAHTQTHTHTHDGTNGFAKTVENFSELNTSQIKDYYIYTGCIYRVYLKCLNLLQSQFVK